MIAPRVVVPIHWGTLARGWPFRRPTDPAEPAPPFRRADGPPTRPRSRCACLRPASARSFRAPGRWHRDRPAATPARAAHARVDLRRPHVGRLAGARPVRGSCPRRRCCSRARSPATLTCRASAPRSRPRRAHRPAERAVWPLILWLALPLTVLTLGLACARPQRRDRAVRRGNTAGHRSQLARGRDRRADDRGHHRQHGRVEPAGDRRRRLLAPQRRPPVCQAHGRAGEPGRPGPAAPGDRRARTRGAASARSATATRRRMAAWLREGSHALARWETDWSSQTGACQAGLLHGDNHDMPAFRWWEKDRGAAIVTNHPRDAAELERRHSNGRGLLFADGASRANILSGDAPHSLLTMSTVLRRDRQGRIGQDYFAYFASPYNATRTLVLVVARGLQRAVERLAPAPARHPPADPAELRLCARARVGDGDPARPAGQLGDRRHVRGPARHLLHVPRLRRGRPPLRDRAPGRRSRRCARSTARSAASRSARSHAPRPYELVVLSDHGQSQGDDVPRPLRGVARGRRARGGRRQRPSRCRSPRARRSRFLGASLTEASAGSSLTLTGHPPARKGHSADGEVHLGTAPSRPPGPSDGDDAAPPRWS